VSAKFLVEDTMTIEARNLFVIAGHVLEGKVNAGMRVSMQLDVDTVIDAEIHSIERVLAPAKSAPSGLGIYYADHDELTILQSLKLAGQVLEIADAA